MSDGATADFEALLRQALAPVDPPAHLVERLEQIVTDVEAALVEFTDAAAEELEAWEVTSMRDPRNWARPAGAAVAGTAAGVALMVVRSRRGRQTRQSVGVRKFAERVVREVADEAQRILDEQRER
jgi:hypothetical protein